MTDAKDDGRTGWAVDVACLVGLFVVALVLSWGRWLDPVIDFGRELYIPWRLIEGDMLYRDLVYFNGPLSPYVNAAWMSVFGVSLRSLVMLNALVVVVTLGLVYGMLREVASRWVALVGGISFVVLFAVAQFEPIGNSNWITPYSHEMTHGISLSLAGVYALYLAVQRKRLIWFGVAGVLTGLVFLTKAEVFLAAFIGQGCGMLACWRVSGETWRDWARQASLWLATALLPLVVAWGLLCLALPAGEALMGTLGTWPHVFAGSRMGQVNYKFFMGTDAVGRNLLLALGYLVGYGVCVAGLAGLASQRVRVRHVGLRYGLCVCLACVVAGLFVWRDGLYLLNWPRCWLVLLLVVWGGLAIQLWRRPGDLPGARVVLAAAGLGFSMALMAKMLLHVRVWHYGFGLGMPACMAVIACLGYGVPKLLGKRVNERHYLVGFVLSWGAVLVLHGQLTAWHMKHQRHPVGTGANRFLADSRGVVLEVARQRLAAKMQAGDRLVVFPEGTLMNVFLEAPAGVPLNNYAPGSLISYGEEDVLAGLQENPPEWVLLVHRDNSEHGAQYFGVDYGADIGRWIRASYAFEAPIGAFPYTSRQFGVLIGRYRGDAGEQLP